MTDNKAFTSELKVFDYNEKIDLTASSQVLCFQAIYEYQSIFQMLGLHSTDCTVKVIGMACIRVLLV